MDWAISPFLFEISESVDEVVDSEQIRKRRRQLVCLQCGAPITWERARIEMRGAHEHSFFNPYGIVFRIGCFREAPGCRPAGPTSSEFSWFPGYHWKTGHCFQCATHLGWSFSASAQFFGLILNRLTTAEHDAP